MVLFFSSTPTNVPIMGICFPAPAMSKVYRLSNASLPAQSNGQLAENKGLCKMDLQMLWLNIQLSIDSARAALYIGCYSRKLK